MTADAIHRASTAKSELRETEKAFEAVRLTMLEQIARSPLTATEEREKLYLGVQTLDAVKKTLFDVIAAGDMEQAAQAVKDRFRVV